MTKQEVNEYLAERLFDLKVCKTTGLVTANKVDKDTYWNNCPCPDYHTEWWRVIEKFGTNNHYTEIAQKDDKIGVKVSMSDYSMGGVTAFGATIGEAVCRCAVEYLLNSDKRQEKEAE